MWPPHPNPLPRKRTPGKPRRSRGRGGGNRADCLACVILEKSSTALPAGVVKSIQNLPKFAALAKAFWVFDNSNSDPALPPVMVARGVDGVLVRPPLPSFELLDQQLAKIPVQAAS